MGQGVNTKMLQVAQAIFGIAPSRIKIETTNTTRVARTSPTAASASADLNGKATENACQAILARLKDGAAEMLELAETKGLTLRDGWVFHHGEKTELTWEKLIFQCYERRINMSEYGFYATPGVYFDPKTETGHPFAYHVYGTAIIIATLDVLRGTYQIDAVKAVHDFGKSMNEMVDKGQAEGGIVQGIGWMTMEEIAYNKKGVLLSNALSTYKVPDIYSVPKELDVHFLETGGHPKAIFKSKAIGEPPLMYGIGAYFAIRDAIRAARKGASFAFSAPITPEKVLLALYGQEETQRVCEGEVSHAAN